MYSPGPYPDSVDLTNCDREPIHIIGTVQSHGGIIVCDSKGLTITRCSKNLQEITGIEISTLLNSSLDLLFLSSICEKIKKVKKGEKIVLPEFSFKNKKYVGIVHLSGDEYIIDLEPVELEPEPMFFRTQLSRILNSFQVASSVPELSKKAVSLVKELFGYNRVMLYRFDEEWNGEVIAEEKEEEMESWLGLHYPATDIPQPAREIFLKQEVRIISDVLYEPSPIVTSVFPEENPVDLSKSEVRGVSPIHIEYLKNMKVRASLTAAIILEGKLWGLIACHHNTPKFISFYQRQSLELLTQTFSNKLAVHNAKVFQEKMISSEKVRKKLAEQMQHTTFLPKALLGPDADFSEVVECTGAAVYFEGKLWMTGKTPAEEDVRVLVEDFLILREEKVFFTSYLSSLYSEAAVYKENAAGVLAVKFGEQNTGLLVWFRQETIETVSWGGKPQKNAVFKDGVKYLSPRKSFDKWSQQVSGTSLPWKNYDIEAVTSLQESVTHAILKNQKDKIDVLNKNLTLLNNELEMFTYGISHDLRAPLRGIEGYAHILEEDYLERLDEFGRKVVKTIISSAETMDDLIDALLSLGKLGKTEMALEKIGILEMVEEVLSAINLKSRYPSSEVKIDRALPDVWGDRTLMFQLLSNLIDNALKYSAKNIAPQVEIGYSVEKVGIVYFIKDNGIGFDPAHKEKVFSVFSRLVKEEYTGTGIGLATAKKVVERHNGNIWVETVPGEGSTFCFTLRAMEEMS